MNGEYMLETATFLSAVRYATQELMEAREADVQTRESH